MKDVVVFDLDGTLANVDHRVPLIKCESPDWDAFFKACPKDKPNKWCVKMIAAMAEFGLDVKIVSARSKVVMKETRAWIKKALRNECIDPGWIELIMLRDVNDHTPDVDLKRAWLKEFGKDRILMVVDDRQRVVDMWRKEGLTCLQCYAWEEVKRQKSNDL